MVYGVALGSMVLGSFCFTSARWPSASTLAAGGFYTLSGAVNVDTALIDVEPLSGPATPFQISTVDVGDGCGAQLFAVPAALPPGAYRFTATLYPCNACPTMVMRPKVFEVK